MNDAFSESLAEVAREVTAFHQALRGGQAPPPEEVQRRFVRLIDRFADAGRTRPGRREDYELARCALVYWIDEMLTLHVGWSHAEDFREICLELHYPELKRLKERSPGERDRPVEGPYRFYEMAEVAKARDEPDALEAFLVCVGLGFRGQYDMRDDDLREWASRVHERVRPRLLKAEQAAGLDGAGPGDVGRPLRRLRGQDLLLGVSALAALTAIGTLAAFLVAVHARPY